MLGYKNYVNFELY